MTVKPLPIHDCVVCRDLPLRPFDPADVDPEVEYRPAKALAIKSGKTKRSFRCHRHTHAKRKADSLTARTRAKAKSFGVPRAVQVALWEFQGRQCPCGRKRSQTIPEGINLHHDRVKARTHDHPDDQGCLDCVVVFLCVSCNRDVIGRLERTYAADYQRIALALTTLAAVIIDRPLAQLLAERPDLLEKTGEGPRVTHIVLRDAS
jgi:hypothetical protein